MSRSIVLSTCGNVKEARKIGRDLVKNRLAACVNIVPVTSYYRWRGKLTMAHEYLLIIKTRSQVFRKLKQRILALHSYELPEIVSLRIDNGYKPYLAWIDRESSADT